MASKAERGTHRALPSRQDILDFIASHPGKVGKREIARAFNVTGGARIGLKTLLREMTDEGLIERRGRHVHQPGKLPPVAVLDITHLDAEGDLVASPSEWDSDLHGEAPRVRVVVTGKTKAGPAPGVGDRILARIEDDIAEKDQTARIIKVLTKRTNRVLGVMRAGKGGPWRLVPIDKKSRKEFEIAPHDLNGAKTGELVSAEPLGGRGYGLPKARVKERLADVGSEKAVSLIAIHNQGIPHEFSKDVLAEAKAAQLPGLGAREDLRALPFITIDPADAKDHDDAVHAAPDKDEKNKGGFIVWVAIADVSHFVRAGSALDREALKRGNSVYFPDRVVPMLPERISNDLCSLREGEDRPALVLRMVFDKKGTKRGHRFSRALIRSAAKLSYNEAQDGADGIPEDKAAPLVDPVLKPLWAAYEVLASARDNRQPLDLDLPERKLLLDKKGRVEGVMIPPRLSAHRLIEEFMIQANVAAAETLEAKRNPFIYRVHDAPAPEKLIALREFLDTLNIPLSKAENLKPAHFNRILAQAEGKPFDHLVNEVVLRSQSQAEYTAENYGHFGLNLRRYAHFTSPIRRYADLIVHRALVGALGLGEGGYKAENAPGVAEIAAGISAAERRAMAAERETVDRLIAGFLADQVGTVFNARIGGVTRAGLFVRLDETGADGFVPLSSLDYDYFHHDETLRAVIGERTGTAFQMGDRIEVRLMEVTPVAGAMRFEVVSDGKIMKALDRIRAKRGPRTGRRASAKKPARRRGAR